MSVFLEELGKLSAAEEFLNFLEVPYDPQMVQVNRLHILKRFHNYLEQAGLPGDLDEPALREAYREHMQRAYSDFLSSNGVTEKLFKVFQQAEKARKASFVPLSAVSRKE